MRSWLPRGFDAMEYLGDDQRLQVRADEARWLVSLITHKSIYGETDGSGFARLRYDYLRDVMSKRWITPIISALVDGGAIELSPHMKGVKSRGYRLGESLRFVDPVRWSLTHPVLTEKIKASQQKIEVLQVARRSPLHLAMIDFQEGVTIDGGVGDVLDAMKGEIDEQTTERRRFGKHSAHISQSAMVGHIFARDLRYHIGSTGRVFNATCGLKRIIRPYLRLNGQRVAGADIRTSQPAMLAMLLAHATGPKSPRKLGSVEIPRVFRQLSLGQDVESYAEDCFTGELYDRLAGDVGEERDAVKKRVLTDVIAQSPFRQYPSDVRKAFAERYPTVYDAIREINRPNYATLIRLLQSVEAWVVFDGACPRLVGDNVPCFTIHDSIYSATDDAASVRSAFSDTFRDLGLRLSLKEESCAA